MLLGNNIISAKPVKVSCSDGKCKGHALFSVSKKEVVEKLTKEQFISEYAKKSEISEKELLEEMVALPCSCEDKSCKGWAMVGNSKLSIRAHNDLYNKEQVEV